MGSFLTILFEKRKIASHLSSQIFSINIRITRQALGFAEERSRPGTLKTAGFMLEHLARFGTPNW
jgi:hypothetical protein